MCSLGEKVTRIRMRRPKSNVVEIDKAFVEIIKDGEIVSRIYPTKEGIKIESLELKRFESSNGEDIVPSVPVIFMSF